MRVRATVFTTGRFALAYPDLIQGALAAGHEIGAHGWEHPGPSYLYENYRLTTLAQRRDWLVRTGEAIGTVIHQRPRSFRAPFLWIDAATFGLLEELGYTIDSSIPARRFDGLIGVVNHRQYFWASLEPYYPDRARPERRGNSSILEVPPTALLLPLNMSTVRFAGLRACLWMLRLLAGRVSALNFYCHPWEFVRASQLEFPPGSPSRHQGGIGPQLLPQLRAFLEAALAQGYTSSTVGAMAA
jgi:hypothetical protein